ncbi:hypothetical protein MKW94_029220 [Papaver nudicaule]|uniref:Mediator complex subunit 15 KIX domain-containing protein n=1 Tax=Papaver nudicaule TaxID=74823 RepID=A0AA41S9B7_PAPNU|nr:hypothetical protein [Papaver nudicaule]
MDNNNLMPAAKAMDATDWRSQLQPDARQRIIAKMMETLKKHLPSSGTPEGFIELNKIVARFEEKVFTAATSQTDYLRKIALKMLIIETKGVAKTLPLSTGGGGGQNPQDRESMHQQAPVLHLEQQLNALSLHMS